MTFLADVNVWLALAIIEHKHHEQAIEWFESISGNTLAFCRVTQMAFLRLLTNVHVMNGDQLTPDAAWRILDRVYREIGPVFVDEPDQVDKTWRGFTLAIKVSSSSWTDAYLAAFAQASGYTLVSFDRGMSRFRKTSVQILGNSQFRK